MRGLIAAYCVPSGQATLLLVVDSNSRRIAPSVTDRGIWVCWNRRNYLRQQPLNRCHDCSNILSQRKTRDMAPTLRRAERQMSRAIFHRAWHANFGREQLVDVNSAIAIGSSINRQLLKSA